MALGDVIMASLIPRNRHIHRRQEIQLIPRGFLSILLHLSSGPSPGPVVEESSEDVANVVDEGVAENASCDFQISFRDVGFYSCSS